MLAQLTEAFSGADLERFVVRARQEVLLAGLRAGRKAPARAQGWFAMQLALEIWHARAPDEAPLVVERVSAALRPALVHFIDCQTRERPSARVVSALTGIPASTVARIRQQRDRGPWESQPGEQKEGETR